MNHKKKKLKQRPADKDFEKKLEKVLQACAQIKPRKICHVAIEHDEGCPALLTHNLADCICQPDIKKVRMG